MGHRGFTANARMLRGSAFIVLWLSSFLSVSVSQASCPPPPVILHSTLLSVCSQEPARSAIGCSMYRLCKNETLDPPIFSALCNTWRVASSLCSDDGGIADSIGLCNQLQGYYQGIAQFRSCMVPYKMTSTSEIRSLHLGACSEMVSPADMLSCLSCTPESCPDPLVSYSEGCYSMDMGQCEPWLNFCLSDGRPYGDAAAVLCLSPDFRILTVAPPRPPSPPPDPPTPSPSPPPSPPQLLQPARPPPVSPNPFWSTPSCITNSSLPQCASYEYPSSSITADIMSLCTSMPYMPGCTIRSACQAGNVTGDFCRPMTLLATICVDMPSMSGCKSYVALCKNTSVVQQCRSFPAIPGLPSINDARKAVIAMCSSMDMVQCQTCTKLSCSDYLTPLSSICNLSPTLSGCSTYQSWCSASAAWQVAAGSSISSFCKKLLPPPAGPPIPEPVHLTPQLESLPPSPVANKNPPQVVKKSPPPAVMKKSPPPAVMKKSPPPAVMKKSPPPAVMKKSPPPAVKKKSPPPAVMKKSPPPAVMKKSPPPAVMKKSPPPAVMKKSPPPAVMKKSPPPAVMKKSPPPAVMKKSPQPAVMKKSPQPAVKN
ncbi:hypothetical protein Vafri_3456 [Volvox africanus]|uniref:Uncharacterized protein n=1 Tax=Volvox africanus TaxID=51714 RepID=A0A8J4AVH1_9CHLO|nr:hypothetical protein Vafri_3456 [Volvox africanus]